MKLEQLNGPNGSACSVEAWAASACPIAMPTPMPIKNPAASSSAARLFMIAFLVVGWCYL